jgi:phosphopantetheinyl transferase
VPITAEIELIGDIRVALWQISEPEVVLTALAGLCPSELSLLRSYKNQNRRMHWLAYRAALQQLLSPQPARIVYDSFGKPLLETGSHCISVSHAGEYAAVVLSGSQPVGIDIEQIRDRIVRVKERFLSLDERKALPESASLEHLYYYWCGKEALYKIHGRPDLDFQNDIRIHPIDYLCNPVTFGQASIAMEGTITNYTLYSKLLSGYMLVAAFPDVSE